MVDAKAGLYVFLAIAFTCLVGGLLAVGIVEVLRSSGVLSYRFRRFARAAVGCGVCPFHV